MTIVKTFKRWTVEWTDADDDSLFYRKSFADYEDAVIKAKVTGSNAIFDRIEFVWIDL
jgi:hypothetical protein